MLAIHCTWMLALVGIVMPAALSPCEDLDTLACQALQTQTRICSDSDLAKTVCPRFCNLCPMTCYHCNTTGTDHEQCKNTVQCQSGEICMLKELHSFSDNHVEYQMTCEPKQRCDGDGLSVTFVGKRDVSSRDLSISCCDKDLCNYPGSSQTTRATTKMTTTMRPTTTRPTTMEPTTTRPTTTRPTTTRPTTTRPTTTRPTTTTPRPTHMLLTPKVCMKDIIIMVEESPETHHYKNDILQFLSGLIADLDIGRHASLVSMATYSKSVDRKWDLDSHVSKPDLLQAISTMAISHGDHHPTEAFLEFVNHNAATSHAGDRPGVDDVIVFLGTSDPHLPHHSDALVNQLHAISDDVIVIGWHDDIHSHGIATNSIHEIEIEHSPTYSTQQHILQLICQ